MDSDIAAMNAQRAKEHEASLRLSALQMAADLAPPEATKASVLADARAFHDFLIGKETSDG